MAENPFETFAKKIPPDLIGREREVDELMAGITEPFPRSFQIAAMRTLGATALLQYISHPDGAISVPKYRELIARSLAGKKLVFIYLDCAHFDPLTFVAVDWLLDYLIQTVLESGANEGESLKTTNKFQRLFRLISQEESKQRFVIILDHFDRVLHYLKRAEAINLRPLVSKACIITSTERPLAEINDDAASSLFGGQPAHLTLDELDVSGARKLIGTVLRTNKSEDSGEYLKLLPWTGLRPYYILHGSAVWFDMKMRYSGLPPDQLIDLFPDTMLSRYRLDFVHFWNHISEREKEALFWLVESSPGEKNVVPTNMRHALNSLMDKGLVNWSKHYQPFSLLWTTYIKEKHDEQKVAEVVTKTGHNVGARTREKSLLQYLQKHAGTTCTYEELMTAAWGIEANPANLHQLRQSILKLRRLLDAESNHNDEIITHRNLGYEYRLG